MVRIGRIVLVALLVALIPAKGFAAARMLFCGVATDRVGMLVQSQHVQHGVDAAMASPATNVTDAVTAQPPCHSMQGSVGDAPPAQDDAPGHEGSCSMCAVCAASTAIAGEAAIRSAFAAAAFEVPASTQRFIGHIPPPLDRPPL